MNDDLSSFGKNVYSQFGEDGIISQILSRISKGSNLDKWCVAFGAWDGVFLSNTCRLIREEGYSAVLIEGDKNKVNQLNVNFPQKNVYKICKFVNFEGESTLENILSDTSIPQGFDFLSIDIDGVDYYIFEGLNKFTPKVICIEFNGTIPNAVDFVQPKNFSVKQGSSAKAICRLAAEKGYTLVSTTISNLLFVRSDLVNLVVSSNPNLEKLNILGNDPQYLFVGFDGTLLSNKSDVPLPWHRISAPISKIQFLPSFLRIFISDYKLLGKFYFILYISFRLPKQALNFISKKFLSHTSTH
jgi:hypothetical protein